MSNLRQRERIRKAKNPDLFCQGSRSCLHRLAEGPCTKHAPKSPWIGIGATLAELQREQEAIGETGNTDEPREE